MENTRSYLGMFIISPDKEESLDDVKNSISAVISDNSGTVVEDNMKGKKKLSYPVKKKTEGIYYEVVFNADPGTIAKMMRQFQINVDILRALIDKKK